MTTPAPTPLSCESDWKWNCRSVISYIDIIHPMWSAPRIETFDDDGDPLTPEIPVLDANGEQIDHMCTGCHTFPYIDPVDQVTVLPPAGQLELTDGLSNDEPDHYHAYRELLVTDNLQFVDANGVLTDVTQVIGVDANGDDIVVTVPQPSPASIAGARASSDFFDRFNDPNDLHFNIFTKAEQRLVAEWLDVGAQYYNNPFDAPAN